MRRVELNSTQKKALYDMLEANYSNEFDPAIGFKIEAIHLADGIEVSDVIRELRQTQVPTFFSVLSAGRKDVIESVQKGLFPASQYFATTPRIALKYVRGHRSSPRIGDPAPICIVKDKNAVHVGSPSILQTGSEKAAAANSHHKSSSSAVLVAVVQARIAVSDKVPELMEVTSGVKRKVKRPAFGEETDENTKRKMLKIRRKRMDNFGIKEDF